MRISDWSSDVCSSDLAEYAFTLANSGPIAAAQPTLVIEGNTMTATAPVQAPAGRQCSKQYNGGPRSATVTCTAASLAADASADFAVRVNTRPTPPGRVSVVQGAAGAPTPAANPPEP